MPVNSRRVGRQRDNWLRTFHFKMTKNNLEREDLKARAEELGALKRLVADLWTSWGPKWARRVHLTFKYLKEKMHFRLENVHKSRNKTPIFVFMLCHRVKFFCGEKHFGHQVDSHPLYPDEILDVSCNHFNTYYYLVNKALVKLKFCTLTTILFHNEIVSQFGLWAILTAKSTRSIRVGISVRGFNRAPCNC